MSELIPFCNDWAVGLFGSVLAAYFCSALTGGTSGSSGCL